MRHLLTSFASGFIHNDKSSASTSPKFCTPLSDSITPGRPNKTSLPIFVIASAPEAAEPAKNLSILKSCEFDPASVHKRPFSVEMIVTPNPSVKPFIGLKSCVGIKKGSSPERAVEGQSDIERISGLPLLEPTTKCFKSIVLKQLPKTARSLSIRQYLALKSPTRL